MFANGRHMITYVQTEQDLDPLKAEEVNADHSVQSDVLVSLTCLVLSLFSSLPRLPLLPSSPCYLSPLFSLSVSCSLGISLAFSISLSASIEAMLRRHTTLREKGRRQAMQIGRASCRERV